MSQPESQTITEADVTTVSADKTAGISHTPELLETVGATAVNVTCAQCGAAQGIHVPNNHDGTRIGWDCAACGARNDTDGEDPATVAERIDAEEMAEARKIVQARRAAAGEPEPVQVRSAEKATATERSAGPQA